MIDYLVPSIFTEQDSGRGGGMHTKVERVRRATGAIYQIHIGSDLSEMLSNFLLIEPLYFRMSEDYDLDALRAHDAKKILYCSEMEMFRWTGQFRKELLELCDVVTCNCDYQESLFRAFDIENPARLIDPIPEDDFAPLPKKLQVVSMGRISKIKNSSFVAELFELLSPTQVETVYIGGAGLWGAADPDDLEIEERIRDFTDVFYENMQPVHVPKAVGASAIFVAATIHDVSALSHCEALMSACLCVTGQHPVYSERPGFSGYKTSVGMFNRIEKLTQGFTALPDARMGEASRVWAEEYLSFATFRRQLTGILGSLYE